MRPVYRRTEPRVRTHILPCMFATSVERHMRRKLEPMPFDDEDAEDSSAWRPCVVAPARVSMSARAEAASKRTPEGDLVHSFSNLIGDLATITRNTVASASRVPISSRSPRGPATW